MCGFLAEYCFDNQTLSGTKDFTQLLMQSKNRGPDSTAVTREEGFQLGFNRLSILDLSVNGNQPKKSPSARYHVVFNGEIYNYKDLAAKYQLKNLGSSSDTEVLVHLFDRLGIEQTIKNINGMFAIAVVDTKTNTFYITRDFAGIKPLFYGISDHGVVAASQFDQVFKHEWFRGNLKLRKDIVKEYFGFGYMQAPNTIYQHIFQVTPGELIRFDHSGELKKEVLVTFKKEKNII